jgi:hypothetical protein
MTQRGNGCALHRLVAQKGKQSRRPASTISCVSYGIADGRVLHQQERSGKTEPPGAETKRIMPAPFRGRGIEAIAKARSDGATEMKQWVEGCVELPLEDLLARRWGSAFLEPTSLSCRGMRCSINHQQMMINAVLIGSAAHAAGLSAGDQILAIDGLKASEPRLKEAIRAL